MNIEVVRESDSKLERSVWRFWLTLEYGSRSHINVVLDSYSEESRPTTRHKYTVVSNYGRVDRRHATIQNVQDVPRPDDVRYEAAEQAQRLIQVVVADARDVVAPFRPEPEERAARAPLRWEAVPFGRGDVEAFVDVQGLGRYLVSRAGRGSREFYVRLNGGPVIHRGTSDACKQWVQLTVDEHRLKEQGL